MFSFPGEDRIMADAQERAFGVEIPDYGNHHPGCACSQMTEEEYENDNECACNCEECYKEDRENDRVDAILSRLDD